MIVRLTREEVIAALTNAARPYAPAFQVPNSVRIDFDHDMTIRGAELDITPTDNGDDDPSR